MKMDTNKNSATMATTTTTTTMRKTPVSSPTSFHKTGLKNTGRGRGRGRGTSINVINDGVQISSKTQIQLVKKCNSDNTCTTSLIVKDDVDEPQQIQQSCNSDSNLVPITCSRSEPIDDGSSSDSNAQSCDMQVNFTHQLDDDQQQDKASDHTPCDQDKKQEDKEDVSSSSIAQLNVSETEKNVEEISEEQNVVVHTKSDGIEENGGGVENDNQSENNIVNDKETIAKSDSNGEGDQLKNIQIKSKTILNPKFTPSPSPSTSATARYVGRRSILKPTSSSPTLPSKAREESYVYVHIPRIPETHGKLQFLVDLVMWRDVSKSAFIFGVGTFTIISSSYAKDFNFSLISAASYLTLVYLAIVFLSKSLVSRGVIDDEVVAESYVWGEDEAIWVAKMALPYLNEAFLKLRVLFSGDPAITMKVALVLFILARCGSSITVWNMVKLGFFGVFIIPKLCSSYSNHIIAYGKFWIKRFEDAWISCSHKKALAFAAFLLVWKFSSVVARAWAAFMLFVAFRCYHQYSMSQNKFDDEQTRLHNVRIRSHSTRQRYKVSTSKSTSLDQMKEKKSF